MAPRCPRARGISTRSLARAGTPRKPPASSKSTAPASWSRRSCERRSMHSTQSPGSSPATICWDGSSRASVSGSSLQKTQVLAVDDIHDVVVPALDLRLHQMLVDVEVERDQRVIVQHYALGLLQQLASLRDADLRRGSDQQSIVCGVAVVSQVEPEVALQVLGERVGIVVISHPARAEKLHLAAVDVLQQ